MTKKPQICVIPFTPEQIYKLVADVKSYPEFLPWCVSANIHKETPEEMLADLSIGYGLLREKFTSHVHLDPFKSIDVECIQGPLNRLSNSWKFKAHGDGQTEVEFLVDYEFSNPLLQMAMDAIYDKAFSKMTQAFETRARQIYGT